MVGTSKDPDLVIQIQRDIVEEIFKAAKFPKIGIIRKIFRPLFELPTKRFSEFIAEVDMIVGKNGFVSAANLAIRKLCDDVIAIGKKNIPLKGPLIIASNHPGTYDGFAIVSQLPRDDVKIMVSGIPFFKNLPNTGKRLIFSTQDTTVRMNAIRNSIRQLEEGGTLLIFPSGRLDPDPSILTGAEKGLERWSRSIEVFLRKVPQTKLVLAITSGVLSKEFVNHPFTRIFKNDHEKLRITEFMQVIKQMVRGKPVELHPKVTFSEVISLPEKEYDLDSIVKSIILPEANQLLGKHIKLFYLQK